MKRLHKFTRIIMSKDELLVYSSSPSSSSSSPFSSFSSSSSSTSSSSSSSSPFSSSSSSSSSSPPSSSFSVPVSMVNVLHPEIEEAHKKACYINEKMYTDPHTGLSVMTESFLLERGTCCGSKCRHCPYNHVNVRIKNREKKNFT